MKKTDPVSVLDLDVSTRNVMARAGVETVGDLMYLLRTGELLKMRNLNQRGYNAIIRQVGMNEELWEDVAPKPEGVSEE